MAYRHIDYGHNKIEIRKLMHERLKLKQRIRHHQKKLAVITKQLEKVEKCMDECEHPIHYLPTS